MCHPCPHLYLLHSLLLHLRHPFRSLPPGQHQHQPLPSQNLQLSHHMVTHTIPTHIKYPSTIQMYLHSTTILSTFQLSSHTIQSTLVQPTRLYPIPALFTTGLWTHPCSISISSASLLQILLTLTFFTRLLTQPSIFTVDTLVLCLTVTFYSTNFSHMLLFFICLPSTLVFVTLLMLASLHIPTLPTTSANGSSWYARRWKNLSTPSSIIHIFPCLPPFKIQTYPILISISSMLSFRTPPNS